MIKINFQSAFFKFESKNCTITDIKIKIAANLANQSQLVFIDIIDENVLTAIPKIKSKIGILNCLL